MTALRIHRWADAALAALAYLAVAALLLTFTLACGAVVVMTLLGTLDWRL